MKNKFKYILDKIIQYLGIVFLVYLLYTGIRQVLGLGFEYVKDEFNLGIYFNAFYLNSVINVKFIDYVGSHYVVDKYMWLLILEILFIFVVPAFVIVGLELKKHNTKVRNYLDNKRAKSTEKKKIKLEQKLKELKNKEL